MLFILIPSLHFLSLILSGRSNWDIQEFLFVTFPFLWLVVFLIVHQAFPGLPGFLASSSCESTCSAQRFNSLSHDCWSQLTAQENHRVEVNLDATVCRAGEKSPALEWQVHVNAARIQQWHTNILVGSSQAEAEQSKLADGHVESVLHRIGLMQWRWNVVFSALCVPVLTMWVRNKGNVMWVTYGIWPNVPVALENTL